MLSNTKICSLTKKYGDFGFIQMPRIMLEMILVAIVILIIGYNTVIQPLFMRLYGLSLTSFNVAIPINNFISSFTILDVNFSNLFYGVSVLFFALILLYVAHKHANEPLAKHGLFTIPSYLLFYSILASIVIFGMFFDLARGKRQKW